MDSHILRKAAARLPALADLAVLRFNFRGVTSPRGTLAGQRSATESSSRKTSRRRWPSSSSAGCRIRGCSAGRSAPRSRCSTACSFRSTAPSCSRHRSSAPRMPNSRRWAGSGKRLVAIIPELDDYLRPPEARERFAIVPETDLVEVDGWQAPLGGRAPDGPRAQRDRRRASTRRRCRCRRCGGPDPPSTGWFRPSAIGEVRTLFARTCSS